MSDDRPLRAAVAAASAILFIPLVVPPLRGRMFVTGDLGWFHIPIKSLYANALRAGDSLLWTPAFFRGFYIHGEGQLGAFHPLHLVLYRLLSLPSALGVEILAIYLIAFVGMRLFLRRLGLSSAAASFGGLLYAFCGYNVLNMQHMNVAGVAAHLPWIAWSLEGLLQAAGPARARSFVTFAFAVGSALLLGYPQVVAMGLLFAGGYAVVSAWLRGGWMRLPVAALAVAAGLAIGAAQVVPTLHFFATSDRTSVTPAFSRSYSMHPWNLLQLWSPMVFPFRVYAHLAELEPQEFSIYNGAFCSVALCWLLLRGGAAARRTFWAAFAVFAVATWMALGRYGGLFDVVIRIPYLDRFRGPARYLLIAQFGLAVIGALMLDEIPQRTNRYTAAWRGLWPLLVPVCACVVTMLVALIVFRRASVPHEYTTSLRFLGMGFALMAGTSALFAAALRGRSWALLLLPIVAAADLGVWGYSFMYTPAPLTPRELARSVPLPPDDSGSTDVLYLPPVAFADIAVMQGRWLTLAYTGIVSKRVLLHNDLTAHQLSGVTWTWNGLDGWRPSPDPMPVARLVADVRQSDDIAHDIHAIDIRRTALVLEPPPALSGPPGTARAVVHRPGRIDVEVTTQQPALLVLTESFDASWIALDGGTRLRTLRVNGDYLGALVPAGTRTVTFRFESADTRRGVALSIAGVIGTIAVAFVLRRGG